MATLLVILGIRFSLILLKSCCHYFILQCKTSSYIPIPSLLLELRALCTLPHRFVLDRFFFALFHSTPGFLLSLKSELSSNLTFLICIWPPLFSTHHTRMHFFLVLRWFLILNFFYIPCKIVPFDYRYMAYCIFSTPFMVKLIMYINIMTWFPDLFSPFLLSLSFLWFTHL